MTLTVAIDDVGNGHIQTGNSMSMADRVPGSGTVWVPGSKDTRKSEHYTRHILRHTYVTTLFTLLEHGKTLRIWSKLIYLSRDREIARV